MMSETHLDHIVVLAGIRAIQLLAISIRESCILALDLNAQSARAAEQWVVVREGPNSTASRDLVPAQMAIMPAGMTSKR